MKKFLLIILLTGLFAFAPPPLISQQGMGPGPGTPHGPGSGPIPTLVQQCIAQGGSFSPVSCTFGSTVGAGHLFIVCVITAQAPGGIYQSAGGIETLTADPNFYSFFISPNSTAFCSWVTSTIGGWTTYSVSGGILNYAAITMMEFSNTGALDAEDSGATGASTLPTSGSITPSFSGDLILCFAGPSGGGGQSMSVTSGWTGSPSTYPSIFSYQVQPTAGAIACTQNLSPSNNWGAHVLAFRN